MGRAAVTAGKVSGLPRRSVTLRLVHWEKVRRGELIAAASGLALAVSVFLHWYSTDHHNAFSKINGRAFVSASAWDARKVVAILLLLAAAAPLILLWIILREHQLSWPRGELTAVVAITAFVLIIVVGFVARPGEPKDTISLQYGWFIALVASIGMIAGAAQRSTESSGPRKPPGTL